MQSSQQESDVNGNLLLGTTVSIPPADHQQRPSTSGELWTTTDCNFSLNQSSSDGESAFKVDFSAMDIKEFSWLDSVEHKVTVEPSTFFQSRSSGEETSYSARPFKPNSGDRIDDPQHDDFQLNFKVSPTEVPLHGALSSREAVIPKQGFPLLHETEEPKKDEFPTLEESLSRKNSGPSAEHQMKNTLRVNAQKIICDNLRTAGLTNVAMHEGDCNQGSLNVLLNNDVDNNCYLLEDQVPNITAQTWSNVVKVLEGPTHMNWTDAQKLHDLQTTFKDEEFDSKGENNEQANSKDVAPYHGVPLPTAQELAETRKRNILVLNSIFKHFEDLKQEKAKRIVQELQVALKKTYTMDVSQNFDFLSGFRFLPLSTAFNLSIRSTNGTLRKITTDNQIFPKYLKTDLKNVVLFGQPNLGKTTFCSCLAFNWTVSKNFFLKCTLCVSVHVSQLKLGISFSQALVTFLHQLLRKSRSYSIEEVRSALTSIEDSILFVIDGYDELYANDHQKLNRFIFNRSEFRESTVLVTARPVVNDFLEQRIEDALHLGGFNFDHSLTLLKSSIVSAYRTANFVERFDKDGRLLYLRGLPPFFLNCVCELVKNAHHFGEAGSCAWPLLEAVTKLLDNKYFPSSGKKISIFVKLGKLMNEALATAYCSFTEQLLQEIFSDKLNLLKKMSVFYQERGKLSNMWTVSSKMLMVFYATFYLRHCWSKLKDNNERRLFLDQVFCFGDSVGNYVTGLKDSQRVFYFVGVNPEIVLSFKNDGLLENAKFEMYHDVEAVECSHAFDSTNLLVRNGERCLNRFGFQVLEDDDPTVEEMFQDIFESLVFDDLCVDYKTYYNMYEDRWFLKVSAIDEADNNVLRFVCRADERRLLDRAHIEFDFTVLESLFGFLSSALVRVLNGLELDEGLMQMDICEFILCLFNSVVKCVGKSSVTVVCHDYSTKHNQHVLENVTLNAYKCLERTSTVVEVLSTLYMEERTSNFHIYQREEMFNENDSLLRMLKSWLKTTENPGLSISIF